MGNHHLVDPIGVVTRGQPEKARLGRHDLPALAGQFVKDPDALGDDPVNPLIELVLGCQRCDRSLLGQRGHRERSGDATQVVTNLGVGDRETNPQPSQPIGLGEGAQHDDIGVVIEKGEPVHSAGATVEMAIRLVHDGDHVLRHPR